MAARKLKVFRTAIGFHDAYVAAPSKKAALAAWGAGTDLFAIGSAEQVTDPKLMAAALARPGEVIRQSRGSEAQHLAAVGNGKRANRAPSRRSRKCDVPRTDAEPHSPSPSPTRLPPPSRKLLDRAERALEDFEASARQERDDWRAREAAMARERAVLEDRQERARDRLQRRLKAARSAHDDALSVWRARN